METASKLVILIAIHLLILYSANSAFSLNITRIHQNQGNKALGPFRSMVNFSFYIIGNLFVSKVRYSEKWQIVICTLTYFVNFLTGFFVSGTSIQVKYILAALGSGVNGFGSSFIWTSLGIYIHKVCHIYHKQQKKGQYFGIFQGLFSICGIVGGVLTTFGLSWFTPNIYLVIVAAIAFIAFLYGIIFIKDLSKILKDQTIPQQDLQQQQKKTIWQSAKQSVVSTIKFYPIMKYSLFYILLQGINIGITQSTMLHLVPTISDKKQNGFNFGICVIMFGVGSVFGGYLGPKLCDKLKIKLATMLGVYIYLMACLFCIFAAEILQLWSARLGCFLWGFLTFYLSGSGMVISSRLYDGKPQSFAVYKQFSSLVVVIYQIIAFSTNNSIPTQYIMSAAFLLGLPTLWGLHKLSQQKIKQESLIHQSQQKI